MWWQKKNRQKAFFDVKVFNQFSRSYVNTPLAQCHRHLEQDKRTESEKLSMVAFHFWYFQPQVDLVPLPHLTVVPCSGYVAD